jgi:quercetin dioxygenase-like cupin family protein
MHYSLGEYHVYNIVGISEMISLLCPPWRTVGALEWSNGSRKPCFRRNHVVHTSLKVSRQQVNFQGMNMALHHASSGELIDIRPLKSNLKNATTKTLYKSNRLEVFQMVLLASKAMPEHQVTGEITVQCIEGSIEFTAAGTSQLMRAGDLICLAGGTVHALKAVEDSSVLVTILLHGA